MAKQALITGGTKGIGRAIAVCLAKAGYDLLLTYNTDETTAANLAAALRKDHAVKVDMLQADITQKESIDRIENRLNDSGVKLDALVLNAGTTYRTTFEEMNLAEWERQFFANVHFPVFLLQRIVGRMQRGAAVVFTGSLMGIEPHATSLSYGVTKSAVHALTRNLVKFLAPYGIRVNAVAPGFVDTDWQKNKSVEIRRNIEAKVAMGRFCRPDEVAEIYRMLIENNYMNGSVVVVDGGYAYR
ncbi:SDR family NAD(P)-dependent oxidoreductase [Tannerella forsythia]|uniref:SDR family NAD(P)-dependent oxidoreductase n=1 Tax=Tannerella forsythia TaxID=28112 RepID=UPI000618CCA3|nr:SDR family oxidoreductase [Tannerella forsythia]BAR50091.1 oxidoreductase, short chaindehydrogenase/reductase family protein [Tannerella forsythia 3313]